MNINHCPVCHRSASANGTGVRDTYVVDCSYCGHYEISGSAAGEADSLPNEKRALASAWLVHNRPDIFNADHLRIAVATPQPSLTVRALAGLRYLSRRFGQGTRFRPDQVLDSEFGADCGFVPHSWSRSDAEAQYILSECLVQELKYVSQIDPFRELCITPKGWLALDGQVNRSSSVGFIAMWFNEHVSALHEHSISPAIVAAGYEPLRIDSKEHNNKIDDEIVASIRAAKFVVADYTGGRGGVYYEAGFAHGLGIPVIFMAEEGTEIHFDVRQFNTIFWKADDLASARDRLKNRILATLGRGPRATSSA